MPAGRPTTYKPEYCDKVDEYLETCNDEHINYVTLAGPKTTGYQSRIKVHLPTIEGFSLFMDVPTSTLYLWRDEHKEFMEALGRIVKEQKKRLLDKGLSGDYNPTIAKLILAANHDMREKTDVTTDGKPLPAPILGGATTKNEENGI